MRIVSKEQWIKYHKALQIKYDKLDQKVGFFVAVAGTVGFVIAILLMNTEIMVGMDIIPETVIVLGGGCFCPLISIAGWRLFFSSWGYLKRLEKYGYRVPEYKKKYCGRLDMLERVEMSLPNRQRCHKESMSLAWISWSAGIVSIPFPVYVWQHYPDMDLILMMMLFPVICWILLGFFYCRQRNQLKFRDDVELDDNRKIRQNLVDGLITIIVCIFLCVLYFVIMYKMADVIYRARLEAGWYGK